MAKAFYFEFKPCGRCGGSGTYSYCTMYGSVCFACGGRKIMLTKRGAAANAFYRSLRERTLSELAVGDLVYMDMRPLGGAGFAKIESIGEPSVGGEANGKPYMVREVVTKRGVIYATPEYKFVKGFNAEEKAEMINAALVFEEMLAKNGKLMKKFEFIKGEKS